MLAVGKKVNELRVCDLKDELEKRKLETVGPKPVLIERLERVRNVKRLSISSIPNNKLQALKEEGLDPNTHLITPAAKAKKQMPLPLKADESDVQVKEEPIDPDEVQVEGADDTNGDEQDTAHHADEDGHEIDQVGDVDDVCVILDDEDDEDDEEEREQEENAKGDASENNAVKENVEPSGDDEMQEENTGDSVTIDNDESINLTIGEDEQQLLHDEVHFELINYLHFQ